MIASWQPPTGNPEYAVAMQRGRQHCVMVMPALFDEANKMRHFTIETMRLLDAGGVDCVLPDMPGCNESTAPLVVQSLADWQAAAAHAATHFGATHVLALRGGALIAPADLPGWRYAAVPGDATLRALLRARVLASKEAGLAEKREDLLTHGREGGLELAGYHLGPGMIAGLEGAEPAALDDIAQAQMGGPGLWLRAEPDHSPEQARALAQIVLGALA